MPQASRLTDKTIHLGAVLTGSSDTLIGGLPAARVDDGHVCPLHSGGPVAQGSSTVLINNRRAARVGDKLVCVPGPPPPPVEPTVGGKAGHKFEPDKLREKEKGYGDDAEKPGEKKEKDKAPLVKVEASKNLAKGEGEVKKFAGEHGKLLAGKYSADLKASAEINGIRDMKAQLGGEASASGSVVSMEAKGEGKYGKASASADVLTAEAKVGGGAAIDTKKGEGKVGVEAGIGAAVFKGKIEGESAGWRIPFTNWEIGVQGGVEGTLLGVEAKGHAEISFNKKDGFKMGAGGKVSAFLAGLGIDIGIFIRPRKTVDAPKPAPDMLATGEPTVLIGDNGLAEKKQRLAERNQLIADARKKAADPATSPEERAKLNAAADRLERNNVAIERARLSEHVYSSDQADGKPPPEGWSQMTPAEMKELGVDPNDLVDHSTGYKANLYKSQMEDPPKIVIAYAGTDDVPDVVTDVRQGLGMKDPQYDKAMDLSNTVATNAKGKGYVVETTGHSLGGGLASAGSAVAGLKGTTFNSAGLDKNTTARKYSAADRANNVKRIDAYHNTSDPLNNFQDSVGLAADAAGNRIAVAPADKNKHSWLDLISLNPLNTLNTAKQMALDGHGMGQMIEAIESEKASDIDTMGGTP